ncbi:MAG TPA: glycosyltransferase family 2 protein, partial [Anaerolineales bacterium]|nr:glycosyltransferase family 2 protein [Anaerolineales bacterium]
MPDLSICIVTLNTRQCLRDCLDSLAAHPASLPTEIIVVDNASSDGTQAMLAAEYPQVALIQNEKNEGFARPSNQAMRAASGCYLLLLNPDTLVHAGALDTLVTFLEQHPQAGIVGPKVLNRDGSLQMACRRGIPSPGAMISYFLKLHRLFPRSRRFGGYLLNYLDEDETHLVDGVSGSCMLVRRSAAEQASYFDEQFFAYQEDADFCFQMQRLGWKVYYHPAARITHFGGQGGSRAQPYRAIYQWHRSYYLYYRKNLA